MQVNPEPTTAKAYLNTGNKLKKEGKLDQAIESYQQALELKPDCVAALNQLGMIYQDRNELEQAIRHFHRLIQLNPNNNNTLQRLIPLYSKVLPKKQNLDEVIGIYKEITQNTQGQLAEKAHRQLGIILIQLSIRQGQLERAVTCLKEATKYNQDSSWLYYNLGTVLAKQNRFNKAVNCYRKAIQIQPKFWQAYVELSQLLQRRGDLEEAFQCRIQAIKLNPQLPKRYYKGINPHSSDEWDLYEITLKEAIEHTKNFTREQYRALGNCFYQKGQLSEAMSWYQKSIYHQLMESKPEFVNQYWEQGKLQPPNFLIIGVAKCGTTALYSYMVQHPQILSAIEKEPHYLYKLVNQRKGIDNISNESLLDSEKNLYLSFFPPRPEGHQWVTGEASPSNFYSGVENLVWNWFPDIKLITILRNPIKRAISRYNYKIINRKKSLDETMNRELSFLESVTDFSQATEDYSLNRNVHLGQGLYVYYLERWMKLFSREQFLVLSNENLAQNPAQVMKKVFDFLELPEYNAIDYTPQNVRHYPKDINPDLLERLKSFYRPHNQRLEELVGQKFNWDIE